MSELEDRLNAVLSDPGELARLTQMAQKLMGGAAPETLTPADAPSGLGGAVGQALGALGANPRSGLAEAIGPYLDESRRERLSRALRMASMAKMAGAALERMGAEHGL